ncbi:20 kda chaperonin [Quercus suber]|uniref:20 kDa chaperonin, chloroplastic n=1 Tax=Quercus suber TaxID=58331 RepID=A0AAW0IXP5_QUESU
MKGALEALTDAVAKMSRAMEGRGTQDLEIATAQFTSSSISTRNLPSFQGLQLSTVEVGPLVEHLGYTDIKTLGDRVLVKIKTAEEKTDGGILVPKTAQTKPRGGEVVATREGKIVGKSKVDISVKIGTQIVYSKHTGTELEFNGSKHLILKDDDIVGILESDDAKEPKPLNDRVLIKVIAVGPSPLDEEGNRKPLSLALGSIVAEPKEKTAGGLLLTKVTKEKPSIGTVIAVGPSPLDEEGNRKPLSLAPGSIVMYSNYAEIDFKGKDGYDYIALRVSDQ